MTNATVSLKLALHNYSIIIIFFTRRTRRENFGCIIKSGYDLKSGIDNFKVATLCGVEPFFYTQH
jgi:hypothetical protein